MYLGFGRTVNPETVSSQPNGVHVNRDAMKPALLAGYEESIQPCIDLIDKLRALGVEQDVHLPTIAVVGDQSAGKSSVLEALSGVQLPRGTGIVTRCPLELRMINKPSGTPWKATISYMELGTRKVSHVINQPSDVGEWIRNAQNVLVGPSNGVCEKLITLEVESPGIPNLTLIDLPGIARVAMDDQPADLPDQIIELIKKYIERDETIILAVIPANVDIATTEALQLARKFDKEGKRTLGVITKPDLVDAGSEHNLIDTILNKNVPLKKGYACVRCRGQNALNKGMTLEQAITVEEDYFTTTAYFRECQGRGLLGSWKLAQKLTQELVEHIKVKLPDLRTTVRARLDVIQENLQKLGKGISTDQHQRQLQFAEVLRGFNDEVLKLVEGRLVAEGNQMRIHNQFRVAFQEFWETLDQYSLEQAGENRNEMVARLEKEIDEWRGSELPYFLNFDMFRGKVKEYIVYFRTPMEIMLKAVNGITAKIYDTLATKYFYQFPELQHAVKTMIAAQIKAAEKSCEQRLRDYMKMEQLTFTQDAFFKGELDKVIEQHVEDVKEQESQRRHGQAHINKLDDVTSPNKGLQAEDMYNFLLSYINIVKKRTADTVPMTMCHELLEKLGENVRTEVVAMVAEPNMIDKFRETETVAVERRENENRYECLQTAMAELDAYTYSH